MATTPPEEPNYSVEHDPVEGALLVTASGELDLAAPDPPRWQQILLGTHPTTVERIALALAATGRSPEGS